MKSSRLVAALALLLLAGCGPGDSSRPSETTPPPGATPPAPGAPAPPTQEQSQGIALEFIGHSPTFRFDGMPETLKVVESSPGSEPGTWDFVITFDCRHGGYGDRTGKIVTQAITPHTARVTVRNNLITRAILDDKWDEIQQKMTG